MNVVKGARLIRLCIKLMRKTGNDDRETVNLKLLGVVIRWVTYGIR